MNLVQTQVILHFENVKIKSILLGYFLFIDIKNLLTNQKTEFSKITVRSYRVGSLTVSYLNSSSKKPFNVPLSSVYDPCELKNQLERPDINLNQESS